MERIGTRLFTGTNIQDGGAFISIESTTFIKVDPAHQYRIIKRGIKQALYRNAQACDVFDELNATQDSIFIILTAVVVTTGQLTGTCAEFNINQRPHLQSTRKIVPGRIARLIAQRSIAVLTAFALQYWYHRYRHCIGKLTVIGQIGYRQAIGCLFKRLGRRIQYEQAVQRNITVPCIYIITCNRADSRR